LSALQRSPGPQLYLGGLLLKGGERRGQEERGDERIGRGEEEREGEGRERREFVLCPRKKKSAAMTCSCR